MSSLIDKMVKVTFSDNYGFVTVIGKVLDFDDTFLVIDSQISGTVYASIKYIKMISIINNKE
ncbi:hypothetical protein BN85410440 [Alteracholeplasma palmae J233]|uniref:LSM domain-containing protein n=1 Tax=Alteracholeplasma palmae (strain ATCC 49389 / J233) TaxID=1318466 RepID=U4KS11_ALTPJ|nr:hypothetical protein [Alteracholeplasma palmae]CCV64621.1 hypothetical protein BN85410440 [Alteracholeplasma palmae J233]